MLRQLGLWIVWLGFIVYVLFFAPPLPLDDLLQPIQTLLSGRLPALNPVVVSLFSMVGIWLLIYSCLIFADGRMQQIPAWIFMLMAIATGVVALIPYLALREPNEQFSGKKDFWLSLLDSRSTGVILTVSTFSLLAFAVFFGDWAAFIQSFQTNKFIHGMTLAFCLFALLFPYPTLLKDDFARRGLTSNSQFFWLVALVPLFGPLAYLCLRPGIPALK
jgi:magnesium-transporting ATPase (P-type)